MLLFQFWLKVWLCQRKILHLTIYFHFFACILFLAHASTFHQWQMRNYYWLGNCIFCYWKIGWVWNLRKTILAFVKNLYQSLLTHFSPVTKVFWRFQGVQKCDTRLKWVKDSTHLFLRNHIGRSWKVSLVTIVELFRLLTIFRFRRVSSKSTETLQILWVSTKFPLQKIRWNNSVLRSVITEWRLSWVIVEHMFLSLSKYS